jgi:hypothetical protein
MGGLFVPASSGKSGVPVTMYRGERDAGCRGTGKKFEKRLSVPPEESRCSRLLFLVYKPVLYKKGRFLGSFRGKISFDRVAETVLYCQM